MSGKELSFAGRAIAVTGARTDLGSALIRLLEADERYSKIVALDIAEPESGLVRAEFKPIDLIAPDAETDLTHLLRDADIDTLVHTAFLSRPTHALTWAHELEDVGTMQVLGAARTADVARIAMTSSTLVYGASADNPVRIREKTTLETAGKPPFLADKIRAERQLAELASECPQIAASVLRFAPIVGPTTRSFITDMLDRPLVVRMLGFDPLIQLTDERDAARAFKAAVDRGARGAFNIASRGVLPLSTVLALLGRVPIPVPAAILRPVSRLLWTTQLAKAPPEMIDFLRFLCVADTARATAELGFSARHHIRDLLRDFGGAWESETGVEYVEALH